MLSLSAQPELQLYDLTGRLTRTIRIDSESEPVIETDRESAHQALLQEAERAEGLARQQLEMMARNYAFVDVKAFWGRAEIDR